MRPRAQTLGFAGSMLFRFGAVPPMPLAPWHPAHPFERYARAPSLALPFPGGSSPPVGPIEMSRTRISSAVGVRPMPYVGPCASTGTHISDANAIGRTLREPIGHAPVPGDLPGLDAVVQPRHAERLVVGFVPVLGDLLARRLRLSDLVDAPRHDLCLLAAVNGHFHLLDVAAAGPGQAANLVEALAGQPLVARRKRYNGLRADLIG